MAASQRNDRQSLGSPARRDRRAPTAEVPPPLRPTAFVAAWSERRTAPSPPTFAHRRCARSSATLSLLPSTIFLSLPLSPPHPTPFRRCTWLAPPSPLHPPTPPPPFSSTFWHLSHTPWTAPSSPGPPSAPVPPAPPIGAATHRSVAMPAGHGGRGARGGGSPPAAVPGARPPPPTPPTVPPR